MMNPLSRARLLGLALVTGAFALGATAGWWVARPRGAPMVMTMVATDAIPQELELLELTDDQRQQIRERLRGGRARVMRIFDQFDPLMRAAVDSTDTEIRSVLSPAQQLRFDSLRVANPRLRRRTELRP
jgi:Spy/CpxP family protein refolding chaperone